MSSSINLIRKHEQLEREKRKREQDDAAGQGRPGAKKLSLGGLNIKVVDQGPALPSNANKYTEKEIASGEQSQSNISVSPSTQQTPNQEVDDQLYQASEENISPPVTESLPKDEETTENLREQQKLKVLELKQMSNKKPNRPTITTRRSMQQDKNNEHDLLFDKQDYDGDGKYQAITKNNSPDEILKKEEKNYFALNVNNIADYNHRIEEYSSEEGASPTFNFRDKQYKHGFYRNKDGYLMCEARKVRDISDFLQLDQPFYLMSKNQLNFNFQQYKSALNGFQSAFIGYAIKANHNFNVLKHLSRLGCGACVVSGNEIQTAMRAGFKPSQIIYNGNGKTQSELELAIQSNILVNIDSEFDLEHIILAGKCCNKKARALLRINPDVDPKVHEYVSTGLKNSKFGIQNHLIPEYLKRIKEMAEYVELVGVHCHIGSTIKDVNIFKDQTLLMVEYVRQIRAQGFEMEYLNIGGGLAIDYMHDGQANVPTPMDLMDSIRDVIMPLNLKLIIEPGRSLVGNTCLLVTKVIGVKENGSKKFIVVNGSMSELLRPSLYDAYHHIELAEPEKESVPYHHYDVVGPVCESGDFLGKNRKLQKPNEGECLVVFDAGAYCQSMSSNYNLKLTCPEYWVDGKDYQQIRKALTLDTYLEQFDCEVMSSTDHEKQSLMARYSKNNERSVRSDSKERVSLYMNTSTNHPRPPKKHSARDIESLTIDPIDEKEEEQVISPERSIIQSKNGSIDFPSGENKINNRLKLELDEGSPNIKLRNLSHHACSKDQKNSSQGQSSASFCMSSDLSNKKRIIDKYDQPNKSSSPSFDDKSEDAEFMQQLQQEQENADKIQKFDTSHLDQDDENEMKGGNEYKSPIFKQGYRNLYMEEEIKLQDGSPLAITPTKEQIELYNNMNAMYKIPSNIPRIIRQPNLVSQNNKQREKLKTAKKLQQDFISPIKYMTQRKIQMIPFEIKEMNCTNEENDDNLNLCANDGGEIDIKQLTASKKQLQKQPSMKIEIFKDKPLLGVKTTAMSANKIPSSSADIDRSILKGLRQPPQSSAKIMSNCKEFKTTAGKFDEGNASAGIRPPDDILGGSIGMMASSRLQNSCTKAQQSSFSSKRNAFRNRCKLSENLSNYDVFSKYKNIRAGDCNSSISSRYVVKLDNQDDIESQQAQEKQLQEQYLNLFETQYEELEMLGEGCSSVVKRCQNKASKLVRAVKIIRSDDDEYIQISKREYTLVKSLNHSNLTKMYDCIHDEAKGTLYLIMEFLDGDTIEDYVQKFESKSKKSPSSPIKDKSGNISPTKLKHQQSSSSMIREELIQRVIKQMLEGIEYLHANGVCHRDLKPDNVIYNPKAKQIKLMDFNASKRFKLSAEMVTQSKLLKKDMPSLNKFDIFADDSPLPGAPVGPKLFPMRTVTGTEQWSAPETRQGNEYTQQVDLWGVGCIMYFMLTMQPPFLEVDEVKLQAQIQECNYDPIPQKCIDFYSKEAIEFVKSCIVLDPTKRPTATQALSSAWIQKDLKASPGVGSQSKYISPKKTSMITGEFHDNTNQKPKLLKRGTDDILQEKGGGSAKTSTQRRFQEERKDIFPIDRDIDKQQSDEILSPFNFTPSPDDKRGKNLRDRAIPPCTRNQRKGSDKQLSGFQTKNATQPFGSNFGGICAGIEIPCGKIKPSITMLQLTKFPSAALDSPDSKKKISSQIIRKASVYGQKSDQSDEKSLIKLQQIKVTDGGYISDEEDENDADDPQNMFKNLNYNHNYFKGKHPHKQPIRRMGTDHMDNIKEQKFQEQYTTMQSGYSEEDEESLENLQRYNAKDYLKLANQKSSNKQIAERKVKRKSINTPAQLKKMRKSFSQTQKERRMSRLTALDLKNLSKQINKNKELPKKFAENDDHDAFASLRSPKK